MRNAANGPFLLRFSTGHRHKPVYAAFHIFNGVFQAVEEFISIREPAVLVFATKREELSDIYDLYLRREQETLAELGYRLEPVANIGPFREYRLRRVKPSEWK